MLKKQDFLPNNAEEYLREHLDDIDKQRVDGLKDLLMMRRSKTVMLERETDRLKDKYPENHPLIKETEEKIRVNKVYVKEIEKEIIYAETPPVSDDRNLWKVYGYVLDSDGNFLPGVVIKLFDSSGGELRLRGNANERGFFQIATNVISSLPTQISVGLSPTQRSEQILSPKLGRVDYSEIIVLADIPHIEKITPERIASTTLNFSGWIVTGRVVDAEGNGVGGLTIQVFDKDQICDEFLDETKTDAEGIYRTTFSKEKFDGFGEEYTELHLVVKDEAGNKLFDDKKEIPVTSARIELTEIKLKDSFNKKNTKSTRKAKDVDTNK